MIHPLNYLRSRTLIRLSILRITPPTFNNNVKNSIKFLIPISRTNRFFCNSQYEFVAPNVFIMRNNIECYYSSSWLIPCFLQSEIKNYFSTNQTLPYHVTLFTRVLKISKIILGNLVLTVRIFFPNPSFYFPESLKIS
jgi:hypothetical protein